MTETQDAHAHPPAVRRIGWGLVLLGLALAAAVPVVHGVGVRAPLLAVAFAIAFHLADRASVDIDVRDQAVAVSASEFLLVLGFFLLSPFELLVARVVGGLGFRLSPDRVKNTVNTGLMLVVTPVMVLVAWAGGAPTTERPATWLLALLAVAAGSLVDFAALRVVMAAATGDRIRIGGELALYMIVWGQVSAAVSLSGVLLASIEPFAVLLAVVPAAVIILGYRLFVRQRHEAARLRTLYDLSTRLSGGPELETVVADAVVEARELLRCHGVELVVHAGASDGSDLGLRVDAAGRLSAVDDHAHAVPAVAGWATLDEVGDGHLDADAVAVPISVADELLGFLAAYGRDRGREAFTATDRTALRALADRVGSVVGRGRLTQELRSAAATTQFLESHDVLTGLGNRRWFVAELDRLAEEHDALTVALLNIRGFRRVNEALGQAAGDVLLVEVADALRGALPAEAAVARLAGDEFAVAVPGEAGLDVELAVGTPVSTQLRGHELVLPVAAGMVVWPTDVTDASGLLRAADLALVVARRQVRGGVVRYDAELEDTIARRGRLANDLRTALASGDVAVHFQPLVGVADRRVVGVEALARWTHPELGPIRPDEFVGVAEESGQVSALTRHVLDLAVAQAAAWWRAGHDLEVAVNVSALDLDGSDLVDDVRHVLDRHGLSPARLVLEVTETAMMADRDRSTATLEQLAALGVGLAIDDFGTGHSSLAYLQDLPVTEIKVDRVFVADVLDNDQSELIVRTVVELAARRGLVVVAEGVEDEPVLQRLASLGVGRVQGWHTGRPVPAGEVDLGVRVPDDGS